MDERDLEPEEAAARLARRSARRPCSASASSSAPTSSTSKATWCIPGPRLARNLPTGVSGAERGEQLDAARRRRAATRPRRPAPQRSRGARARRRRAARTWRPPRRDPSTATPRWWMPCAATPRDATDRLLGSADARTRADGLGRARLGLDVGEERAELVAVERLVLEQRLRDPVERGAVLLSSRSASS